MAFYQDAPDRHPKKKNYAAQGSWDDEGTHYRGKVNRFGPNAGEKSNERPARQGGDYRDGRPAYATVSRGGASFRPSRPNEEQRQQGGAFRDGRASYAGNNARNARQGGRPPRQDDRRNNQSIPGEERPRFNSRGNRPQQRPMSERPARPMNDRPNERYARPVNGRPAGERPMNDRRPRQERPMQEPVRRAPVAQDYHDYEYRKVMPAPMAAPQELTPNENLLAGRNPIREALKSGRDIEKLLVQRGELSGSAREIVQMAKEAHVPVQEVEKSRLDEITLHHQGMLAFASAYQYSTVEAMLADAKAKEQDPFLILLDGVTDPHNLGAIIRSAECAGAHGVIVPERRSVGLTPAAVKASAGAVEHMKVARVTNLNRTIDELKKQGVWTYAVTMDGVDYEQVDFKGGVALVIGAEGEGISRLTLENCDHRVSLPMAGCIDSLNASVAAGIMMYRVLASRR